MNKKIGLFFMIGLLLTINATLLFGQKTEKHSKYINIVVDSTFNEEINREGIAIIDFWATWCKPCIRMMPEYDIAAKKLHDKIRFYKMDSDQSPITAKQFEIESIPCLIIFKNGQEVKRIVGITQSDRIIAELERIMTES
jgi:thioredoxin 1